MELLFSFLYCSTNNYEKLAEEANTPTFVKYRIFNWFDIKNFKYRIFEVGANDHFIETQ